MNNEDHGLHGSPMNVGSMRVDYAGGGLRREQLKPDPLEQFSLWFEQARAAGIAEPNAMTLATAGADGRPSVRTVLLKAFDWRGFVFFTNLESKKARQIAANANVAILFAWLALQRQVIIEGVAEKLSIRESLAYFVTRPKGSQLAAWASPQSTVLASRQALELAWEQMKHKFGHGQVPLPPFWGGYRVCPREFEFWQGRANRLHDRFRYLPGEEGSWKVERLAP